MHMDRVRDVYSGRGVCRKSGLEFFMAIFQGNTLDQVLSLRSAYLRLIGGITGLGMTTGGLIGLWKTVMPLLGD